MTITMKYTTITPKYQVHIPVAIRKEAGLTKHGRAKIKAEGKRIIIEPIPEEESFLALGGILKDKKPSDPAFTIETMRDFIDYGDL